MNWLLVHEHEVESLQLVHYIQHDGLLTVLLSAADCIAESHSTMLPVHQKCRVSVCNKHSSLPIEEFYDTGLFLVDIHSGLKSLFESLIHLFVSK